MSEFDDLLPEPNESGESGDSVTLQPEGWTEDDSPGVLEDGDSSSLVDTPEDDGSSTEVPAESSTEGADQTVDGQAPTESQEGGQAESYFEYGERRFENKEELTQYLSSWDGRLRVASEAADRLATFNDQWRDWSNDPEKLAEQYRKVTGKDVGGGDNAAEAETPDYSRYIDGPSEAHYKMFEDLVKQGKGLEALRMMDEVRGRQVTAIAQRNEKTLNERFEAIEAPAQAQTAEYNETMGLLNYAYTAADSEGNLLYPELVEMSDKFSTEFVTVFAEAYKGLDKETRLLKSGDGIELAYNQTHRWFAANPQGLGTSQSETEAPTPTGVTARDANGRFVAQSKATQEAIGSSPANPPPREVPASYREAHDILDGMDKAVTRDSKLGIRR